MKMRISLATVALGLIFTTESRAQTVAATPAAGYFKLTASSAADTLLSVPLLKRPLGMARVMGVGPGTLTIAGPTLIDGVLAPSTTGSYYVQFVTGNLEGISYKVTGNTATLLTLDTAGETLTAHALGAVATGASGDVVRICPYWTLADVFGATGTSVALDPVGEFSTESYVAGDAVMFFNNAGPGTDKPPAATFAYVTGSGWRKRGESDVDAAGTVLPHGVPFAVRRQGVVAASILVMGYVVPERLLVRVPAVASGEDRDVAVSLAFPAERALIDSGLFSLLPSFGAVEASPEALNIRDAVLEFDSTRRGFSLPAARRYYFNGVNWFEADTNADAHLLQAGSGYLLRLRGARGARYWAQPAAN